MGTTGHMMIEGEQGPASWAYVQGFEPPPGFRVPVDLPEPVTVRQLPAASGQVKTVSVVPFAPGAGVKLLNANELRGRTIIVSDSDYCLGYDKASPEAGLGHIPAGQQLVLTNSEELWVCGGAATTYVTAVQDFWTR